jgi:hypothetical protein
MPCDQRITISVDLGAAEKKFPKILEAGLLASGWRILSNADGYMELTSPQGHSVSIINGKVTMQGLNAWRTEEYAQEIRKAFGQQVVMTAAKKYNWDVVKQSDTQFVVQPAAGWRGRR